MPDVVLFLTRDVLIFADPSVWNTPDSVHNIATQHLVDFGISQSLLESQLICETLHKACQQASDLQTRLNCHHTEGSSQQQALTDTCLTQAGNELPPVARSVPSIFTFDTASSLAMRRTREVLGK